MDRIPGKWEWIEEKLREVGLVMLADRAETMEKSIQEIYGRTINSEWRTEYRYAESRFRAKDSIREKTEVIREIVVAPEHCVACDIDYDPPPLNDPDRVKGCHKCRLAKVHKKCAERDSLFSRIYRPLSAMRIED